MDQDPSRSPAMESDYVTAQKHLFNFGMPPFKALTPTSIIPIYRLNEDASR